MQIAANYWLHIWSGFLSCVLECMNLVFLEHPFSSWESSPIFDMALIAVTMFEASIIHVILLILVGISAGVSANQTVFLGWIMTFLLFQSFWHGSGPTKLVLSSFQISAGTTLVMAQ